LGAEIKRFGEGEQRDHEQSLIGEKVEMERRF